MKRLTQEKCHNCVHQLQASCQLGALFECGPPDWFIFVTLADIAYHRERYRVERKNL